MEELAIKIDNVSKSFKLPHEKQVSIKSMFVRIFRSKKGYELQEALKDISFEVRKGEFFGIVGRNGSGKSTLLKIIAGIYEPTKGHVGVDGKLVPFIELGVGFNPELTGRENVYLNGALLGFSNREVNNMYKDIVDFAELRKFMDQKLKNYSSGMQVRLAFSMAIRAKADILLIDEVLAVGDADFQRKCFEYFKTLKKNNKTVIFVSHDMSAVREFCDRALLIDQSQIKHIGQTSEVANQYSQLFMTNSTNKSVKSTGKRWGNQDILISKVNTKLQDDHLLVNIDLQANRALDRAIYGLHVIGPDGVEVTAMNNRMINAPDIENIKKGEKINLQWHMLNIFNDGKYSITITIIDDVSNTLDWWVEAETFSVKRAERSTTAVIPPVKVEFNKIKLK